MIYDLFMTRAWQEVDKLTASKQQCEFRQRNRHEGSDATETGSFYKLLLKGKGKERAPFLLGTSCGDKRQKEKSRATPQCRLC
jgi:hypothetical protein